MKKNPKHWLTKAFARVSEMDKSDNEAGFATPDQSGIAEIVKCIDFALDAAINLASEGKKEKAREVAEEAVAMALKIKI